MVKLSSFLCHILFSGVRAAQQSPQLSHRHPPKKPKDNFAQCQDGSEMIPVMHRVSLEAQQRRGPGNSPTQENSRNCRDLCCHSAVCTFLGAGQSCLPFHTVTAGSVRASLTPFFFPFLELSTFFKHSHQHPPCYVTAL